MLHTQDRQLLHVMAPLSGMLVPFEQVPDPTLSQKLVEEGVSIDPVSEFMLAPVSGVIVQLHAARHSVVIRTAQDIDVMVHIGLDTFKLHGQGFESCCALFQQVQVGDVLVRFNADAVGCKARSLLTQIVVLSDGELIATPRSVGMVRAGKDCILTVMLPVAQELADVADVVAAHASPPLLSATMLIPNYVGMHARPSALLASCAIKFAADLRLQKGQGPHEANAKSATSIMQLGLQHADSVTLTAIGDDAAAVLDSPDGIVAQRLR